MDSQRCATLFLDRVIPIGVAAITVAAIVVALALVGIVAAEILVLL